MQKKKIDSKTKTKLILQGEYLLIGLVFLILAILKFTNILQSSEIKGRVFNFITLAGSLWIITDFIWALLSKTRRQRVDFLDKILTLPLGLYLITFDLFCIIKWNNSLDTYRFGLAIGFSYASILYIFLAIYHWYKPSKALLQILIEEEKEKAANNQEN